MAVSFRGSELFGVFISLMSVPQTYLVVFLELSKLYPACWSSEIVVYRKEAVTKDLGLFGLKKKRKIWSLEYICGFCHALESDLVKPSQVLCAAWVSAAL